MIAITIVLAVGIAPIVFGVSNSAATGAPAMDLAFSYGEDVESETTDTFGENASSSGGDGLVRIIIERGERIDADQLRIKGTTSGGELTDSSEYESGDTVARGTELTVWAQHGEEIDVIWISEDREESYILETFTVRPTVAGLPPGISEIDYDCDGWSFPGDFDSRDGLTAGSGDLTIDGVVLDCDLSKFSLDNVDIVNDGVNIGTVAASSDIDISDGAVYKGAVDAGGKVDLSSGSDVNSDVTAGTGVDLDGGSTIEGDVDSGNDVNLQSGAQISGDLVVRSGSTLDTADSSILGDVKLVDGSAANDLTDSFVGGNINATDGNAVVVNSETTVAGKIDARGGASVSLDGQSSVGKDVFVDSGGDLTCNDGNDSTITGMGCLDYKAPEFEVTIDGTNDPLEPGNTLEVDAIVENVGLSSGSQTITLDVGGIERDAQIHSVGGQSQTMVTLTWDTTGASTGTYTALVETLNDSDSQSVELIADAPTKFNNFVVTIDQMTGSGTVKALEFDYDLTESDTIEFEIERSGSIVDSTSRTDSGTTGWIWSHNDVDKSFIVRGNTTGGECYEIRIPLSASSGQSFDVLADGSEC